MKCKYKVKKDWLVWSFANRKTIHHSHHSLAQSVKGMLAFGIYITHGVACYVAIDLIWNKHLVKKVTNDRHKIFYEYVVRTLICTITCKLFWKEFHFYFEPQNAFANIFKINFFFQQFCSQLPYLNWTFTFHWLVRCAWQLSASYSLLCSTLVSSGEILMARHEHCWS